jgi:SAM-dependent methyltransferase
MQLDRRLTQLSDEFAALDLHQMQLAVRYTDWLARQIQPHCGRRLLEVGAGIGNIASRLVRSSEYLCALEPNPACFERLATRLAGMPGFECRPWGIDDCDLEFVTGREIDTVVCVNVLEHIENDMEAVERMRGMLHGAAGRIVLVVPAVPAAYGPIDAALGHFRRYTPARVRAVLGQAGFSVEHLQYSNVIGLLGWLVNARLARRVQQSDTQIRLFDRVIVPWSSLLERWVPPPIGLSLIAAARARG